MAATAERKSAADRDLRIQCLNHFTIPVRDHNVARKFYTEVLGGVVAKEPNWEGVRAGRNRSSSLNIKLFDGEGELDLFWQPWGQNALDQLYPHWAFALKSAAQLDEMVTRLDRANVPHVLMTPKPAKDGEQVRVSLFFRDPDMNQIELVCEGYPFRAGIHVGTFDPTVQYYRWADWRAMVPDGGAP